MQSNLSHMYESTPLWLDAFFAGTTLFTVSTLYVATYRISSRIALVVLLGSLVWLISLALLAYNGFFQHLDARPPHFMLVIGLPLLVIFGLLMTTKGRSSNHQLPLPVLTCLHTVRVPVEVTLYALCVYQQVPQLMTFDGCNIDILVGLTAPIMTYFVFWQKHLSTRWLLVWNGLALASLLNIVTRAILSTPSSVQQLAFSQPNVAVLKAPYVWLPGYIVPVVLFSHIVAIQRLVRSRRNLEPSPTRAFR